MPVSIVRPSIIESAWAEPKPGWIRGFRMAEPVIISYARGLLREFPGVPEGTVDVIPVDIVVAAIIAVAAVGPERAPFITQVASGGINPLKYRTLVDNVSGFFTAQPALRPRGPADRRARVALPRPRPRAGPAHPGQDHDHPRREGAAGAAAARQAGRAVGHARVEAAGGRAGARVRRAVRPLHRVRGDLPGRQPAVGVGLARRRRPGGVHRSTRARSTGSRTSTRSTCRRCVEHARVKTTPGKSRTPDRMVRLRKQVLDPKRQVAAFDLENTLIASNVVESYSFLATRRLERPRAGPLRAAHAGRGARAAEARPARPHRLPAPLLPPLRGRPGRPDRGGRARDADPADPHEELPRRPAAGARAPGRRPPHGADHRRAVVQRRRPAAAVRRDRRGRDERATRRHVLGRDDARCRPPARCGPRSSPTTATPRASRSTSASPTPTRRATCRCSRRSASRSRSTPRPAWPRSPASAAGWSSTGRRPRAARARSSRSAR